MTRRLTDAELASLYGAGVCPFCEHKEFFEGPHGGMSINWYCANCAAGFNLGPAEFRNFGQLIEEPGGKIDTTILRSPTARPLLPLPRWNPRRSQ
jgi:hypothetical protein